MKTHHGLGLFLAFLSLSSAAQETQRITVTGNVAEPAPAVAGFGDGVALQRAPFAATVIDDDRRRERSVQSIADLSRLDASVSDAYNSEGYWSFLSIRGFTLDNRANYRRDGLPINAETALPLHNKNALEVIKGTSGMQAGTSAPGGLVNLVVERPQRALRSATLEARQGGSVLAALDLSDRTADGERVGWRVNAAVERLDSMTRDTRGQRRLLALAADARLTRDTLLEAEVEVSHQSQPSVAAFSLLGDRVPDARAIDRRVNLNNQAWSLPVVFDANTASLRLTHGLGEGWRARVHAMTQRLRSDDRIAFPFGCGAQSRFDRYCSDGSFDLYDFRSEGERRRSDALDASLQGTATTGAWRHHVSLGVLATRFAAGLPPQAFNFAGVGRIDGSVQVPAAATPLSDASARKERSAELYLRDRIALTAATQLWTGLRHSRLHRDGIGQSFTTPWLALSWLAHAQTTVYASWGQGVEAEVAPNLPLYSNAARALPALKSRQLEAGVKHASEHLDASLTAFAITRPQSGDFGTCDAAATCTRAIDGRAVHRGVEATLGARGGAWRAQAGAMLLHARRESATSPALDGGAPVNVPAKSLRAEGGWSASPTLEFNAALVHESSRRAEPIGGATLPSWTRVDLGAKHVERWSAQRQLILRLNLDNAFDRRAWKESPFQFGHAYLFPLQPRSLRLSAQFDL